MNTGLNRGTARIYQFPVGGRATGSQIRHEETPSADPATAVSDVACGSGWYHEAAIQESKPVREQ